MLDVIRDIAQIWNGKDRRTDHIFIMHQPSVLGVVSVALCAEADHGGVLLVRDNADHAVGSNGVLIQHEGDGLAFLYRIRFYLFYIDQRTGVIRRLHRTGQYGEHLQSHDSRAHQQKRQKHHQRYQNGADHVPDFLERLVHLSSSSITSGLMYGTAPPCICSNTQPSPQIGDRSYGP